ncbi:transaldolase [Salinispira pacifica]
MASNPLNRAHDLGQSIWLDYIRRDMLRNGTLRSLIQNDSLTGMTSNPKIFDKAITGSEDYTNDLEALAADGLSPQEIYEEIAVSDVQDAADQFRHVYDKTRGADGYVSLEVSPELARDTEGTISEARRLWKKVKRPNVFIKVPGTAEGIPAIRQLISEGININVTLLFGLPRYREVAEAYIEGIRERISQGKTVSQIASVASFFLSRIDVLVDPTIEQLMKEDSNKRKQAEQTHGQVAVSSARVAYQMYKAMFENDDFRSLAERGVRPQKLLWASTSTKNPSFSDVKYVDALIAPETINTMPMETLEAYRDHGDPEVRIENNLDGARDILEGLGELGVDIDQATSQLVAEGIEKFKKPFSDLLGSIKERTSSSERPAQESGAQARQAHR